MMEYKYISNGNGHTFALEMSNLAKVYWEPVHVGTAELNGREYGDGSGLRLYFYAILKRILVDG